MCLNRKKGQTHLEETSDATTSIGGRALSDKARCNGRDTTDAETSNGAAGIDEGERAAGGDRLEH